MGSFVVVVVVSLLFCACVVGKNIYVNSTSGTDAPGCGASSDAGCRTLDMAVQISVAGDVLLCSGTFSPKSLVVEKSISIIANPGSTFGLVCNASFLLHEPLLIVSKGALLLQYVTVSGCSGHAISIPSTADGVSLTVKDTFFVGTGVLSLVSASSSVVFDTVNINNFVSPVVAGLGATTAVLVSGGSIKFKACILTSNIGQITSGVVSAFHQTSSVEFSSSSMKNNSGVNGGVVYSNDASITFHDTDCSSNKASQAGGCVFATGPFAQVLAYSFLNAVSFGENSAGSNGGAIALNFTQNSTFSSLNCKSNVAAGSGGCIYSFGSGSVTLTNNTIIHTNVAQMGNGSGIASFFSDVVLSEVTLDSNSAIMAGGLYASGGSVTASNLMLTNNRAFGLGFGGAGMVANGCRFQLGISMMNGNSHGEGVVCYGAQGTAQGPTTTAVVCGKDCTLTLNGDSNICSSQSFPAMAANSSVVGSSFSGVQGSWIQYMVDVRSVYSTPAQTNGLSILMRKDGLTVANRVTVSSLAAAGTYAINFTCPSAGTFQLYTELNGVVIGNSPSTVTITAPEVPGPNLTGLWVALALVLAGLMVLAGVMLYRKFFRRVSYLPIADSSKGQANYGGTGFESEDV